MNHCFDCGKDNAMRAVEWICSNCEEKYTSFLKITASELAIAQSTLNKYIKKTNSRKELINVIKDYFDGFKVSK